MSTSKFDPEQARATFRSRSALVIGVGGLGCPATLALADAGLGRLVLCDDDRVDLTNLHRQVLFSDADVGEDKLDVAKRVLTARFPELDVVLMRSRFLPNNARAAVRGVDVVLEGADNFATKFLAADACAQEQKPIVHGAAIGWRATAFAVAPGGRPCYRCVFEDVPRDAAPNCDEAGVMGPVVGFCGALMAELALEILSAPSGASPHGPGPCGPGPVGPGPVGPGPCGQVWSYDGKRDRLRATPLSGRDSCPLCGAQPTIFDTREARYLGDPLLQC